MRRQPMKGPLFTKRSLVKAMQYWAKDSHESRKLLLEAHREIKALKTIIKELSNAS